MANSTFGARGLEYARPCQTELKVGGLSRGGSGRGRGGCEIGTAEAGQRVHAGTACALAYFAVLVSAPGVLGLR